MANFDRERIPERQPHAQGGGAFGVFEVTNDVSAFTKAAAFAPGTKTDLVMRFSTVTGERGWPDTWRDPRGFAVNVYTSEGNLDIVGNNNAGYGHGTPSAMRVLSSAEITVQGSQPMKLGPLGMDVDLRRNARQAECGFTWSRPSTHGINLIPCVEWHLRSALMSNSNRHWRHLPVPKGSLSRRSSGAPFSSGTSVPVMLNAWRERVAACSSAGVMCSSA